MLLADMQPQDTEMYKLSQANAARRTLTEVYVVPHGLPEQLLVSVRLTATDTQIVLTKVGMKLLNLICCASTHVIMLIS